jgi:hypothetical protein
MKRGIITDLTGMNVKGVLEMQNYKRGNHTVSWYRLKYATLLTQSFLNSQLIKEMT